jgi:hypothetical protein
MYAYVCKLSGTHLMRIILAARQIREVIDTVEVYQKTITTTVGTVTALCTAMAFMATDTHNLNSR